MNRIQIVSLNKKFRTFEKTVKKIAAEALKYLKKKGAAVEIYLVDDEKIKFLNKKFRGKNKSTNILSFGSRKDFVYPPNRFKRIGEIYLNIPYIKREAARSKQIQLPITKLIIHSFLHLLGYTHDEKSDRIRMERLENRLLQKIKWVIS